MLESKIIVVVDDDISILELTEYRLKKMGYITYMFNDSIKALDESKNIDHIDLLLTDVVMPNINGVTMSKKILEIHPETKLLFTSGYPYDIISDKDVINHSYIQKPYTNQELYDTLNRIIHTK